MSNRLAQETSPYLRQHATNPVDWYPWGAEAFDRARTEKKPILLSIGYAACHWCHVMAHESFEDEATAALMNELFVNIKVDREERPDVDSIYMQAVQAMSGHGGWPMTMFLTPAGEPFWGGTYFPPDDRHGMPSFQRVLRAVADAYANRPEQISKTVAAMHDLYENSARALPPAALRAETFDRAFAAAASSYDQVNGGFGRAPKFPPTMLLEFLLTHWARTGNREARTMAHSTFLHMSASGIHDHVGGGFHRYAVDSIWLVPHFEKMLYDNALLARFGAHLWQVTHDDRVLETTSDILRWVSREMTGPHGGFYASLDADSEGEEGLFYTWTLDELESALGSDAAVAASWYRMTSEGNFEGRNIPNTREQTDAPPPELAAIRARLYDARARRVWPGLDDKIIAGWNGLMLSGVATCARVFAHAEWTGLALRNAEFLASEMVRAGSVRRIWKREAAWQAGFLEDHAAVALGFLDTWQLTGDQRWLDIARDIARVIETDFRVADGPGFYDTGISHESLITRPRDLQDNASPSGSSLAADLFARLGYITGDPQLSRMANSAIESVAEPLARYPHAFGYWLGAADLVVNGATTIVLAGDAGGVAALEDSVRMAFLPSSIVARKIDGTQTDVSIFESRTARDGHAAAYVCRGNVCDDPVTEPSLLRERLSMLSPAR